MNGIKNKDFDGWLICANKNCPTVQSVCYITCEKMTTEQKKKNKNNKVLTVFFLAVFLVVHGIKCRLYTHDLFVIVN